ERYVPSPSLEAKMRALEEKGASLVLFADSKDILGCCAFSDTIKETSKAAIDELRSLGVKTCMLSGDTVKSARCIAEEVGVDSVIASLLPGDKVHEIEKLAAQGHRVGMVGDGINDAPALAQADIGFAMGAMGTDVALETCDVAIMDDDLRKIPAFIRLSSVTMTVLQQNIVLTLGLKLFFVILTFMGYATMWMAVFADIGTTFLVVVNSLRLLTKKW
ncbi:MAG: cation-translocating P-type ATPase, partial [Desulfovibrio sp.]|nr:cation-translocating P-type ATPase [Desulfovibrio sp.]